MMYRVFYSVLFLLLLQFVSFHLVVLILLDVVALLDDQDDGDDDILVPSLTQQQQLDWEQIKALLLLLSIRIKRNERQRDKIIYNLHVGKATQNDHYK